MRVPLGVVGSSQNLIIDPAELEAALARDAAPERHGPDTAAEHGTRGGASC
jgi:hypothetical protein